MLISFENKLLRKLCEDHDEAISALGKDVANKLKSRLADISAITCLDDLVVGNLRKIEKKFLNYELDLCNGFVMTFIVSHISTPINEKGDVDKLKVRRIKITEIKYSK